MDLILLEHYLNHWIPLSAKLKKKTTLDRLLGLEEQPEYTYCPYSVDIGRKPHILIDFYFKLIDGQNREMLRVYKTIHPTKNDLRTDLDRKATELNNLPEEERLKFVEEYEVTWDEVERKSILLKKED